MANARLNRRQFVCAVAASAAAARCARPSAPFDLVEATFDSIGAAMSAGRLSARELCETYVARIARNNTTLRAFIETNPDALTLADDLDRERGSGSVRGPLHGLPIAVKDNIETADRLQTTAGSPLLDGVAVTRDAHVIARLRAAGAIVLGKTNLTEWAGGGGRNGYSTRGGQSVNPYDTARTPMGSSSGSAIAVSANLSAAALGTETMGSIQVPCSLMGVVGVRPTVGLISRSGVVPVALSMDSVGPITRTVGDAAQLLTVLAGVDPEDPATADAPARTTYERALTGSLTGLRIGVIAEPAASAATAALTAAAIRTLEALGATIVDQVALPEATPAFYARHTDVMLTQLKAQLGDYFSARRPSSPVQSVADIVAGNLRRGLDQAPMTQASGQGPITTRAYEHAFADLRRMSRADGIDGALHGHDLDALVSPSCGPAWTFDELARPTFDAFFPRIIVLSSAAGYPTVSVPMGSIGGLPVGLLVAGTAWSEATLLRVAHAFEQVTHHRRPPRQA